VDLRRIEGLIDAHREQLRARYGWTHLEVTIRLEGERLRITGTVAVARVGAQLRRVLEPAVAEGLSLEMDLSPMPISGWYALPSGGQDVWAQHPSAAARSLATELTHADGPVGLLARDRGSSLVCARDGTIGWVDGPLGASEAPRVLGQPRVPDDPGAALCAAALRYVGVPYWLGGNRLDRIDCSGLVQRAFVGALGVLVPRNSNDQLAVGGGGEPRERVVGRAGDLVFLRSRRMARTHVGIATGAGTVIHASRSRAAVVVEAGAVLEGDAEWIRWVGWERIVDWGVRQVGRSVVRVEYAHAGGHLADVNTVL